MYYAVARNLASDVNLISSSTPDTSGQDMGKIGDDGGLVVRDNAVEQQVVTFTMRETMSALCGQIFPISLSLHALDNFEAERAKKLQRVLSPNPRQVFRSQSFMSRDEDRTQ